MLQKRHGITASEDAGAIRPVYKAAAISSATPLDPAKPLILRFGQQPRIFDLGRRSFAAELVEDFACEVGLAVDV